jgi:hypothetical protein
MRRGKQKLQNVTDLLVQEEPRLQRDRVQEREAQVEEPE